MWSEKFFSRGGWSKTGIKEPVMTEDELQVFSGGNNLRQIGKKRHQSSFEGGGIAIGVSNAGG